MEQLNATTYCGWQYKIRIECAPCNNIHAHIMVTAAEYKYSDTQVMLMVRFEVQISKQGYRGPYETKKTWIIRFLTRLSLNYYTFIGKFVKNFLLGSIQLKGTGLEFLHHPTHHEKIHHYMFFNGIIVLEDQDWYHQSELTTFRELDFSPLRHTLFNEKPTLQVPTFHD